MERITLLRKGLHFLEEGWGGLERATLPCKRLDSKGRHCLEGGWTGKGYSAVKRLQYLAGGWPGKGYPT